MVNPGKRMRKLQPLLEIRMGPGAVLLPPSPAPRLVDVRLRKGPGSEVNKLWKRHLQQLKFHNPWLPISIVPTRRDASLFLKFEAEDAEALKRITGPVKDRPSSPRPGDIFDEPSQEEKEMQARNQSPNFRDAPRKDESGSKSDNWMTSGQAAPSSAFRTTANSSRVSYTTPNYEPDDLDVVEDEMSSYNAANPDRTIYSRRLRIGLHGYTADEVWKFFEDRTGSQRVPASPEDIEARKKLDEFFAKAELDRQRVKAGVDAVKKEKRDLERAKGETERLQAEAI